MSQNDIRGIAWGCNIGQKQNAKMGKRINQQFVQIPHARLRQRVKELAFIHGLRFVETEESYTSKASFFDNDLLPVFGEKPKGWKASGKRIKRGLYRTANGSVINADQNGSLNILRKVASKLSFTFNRENIGALTAPNRVRYRMGKFA